MAAGSLRLRHALPGEDGRIVYLLAHERGGGVRPLLVRLQDTPAVHGCGHGADRGSRDAVGSRSCPRLRGEQGPVRGVDRPLPCVRLHDSRDLEERLRRQAHEDLPGHIVCQEHRVHQERLHRPHRGGGGAARPHDPRAIGLDSARLGHRRVALRHRLAHSLELPCHRALRPSGVRLRAVHL